MPLPRVSETEKFLMAHRPSSLRFHLDYCQVFGPGLYAAVRPFMQSETVVRDDGGKVIGSRDGGLRVFPGAVKIPEFGIFYDQIFLQAREASSPAFLRDMHAAIMGRYVCVNKSELVAEVAFDTRAEAAQLQDVIRRTAHLRWARKLPFSVRTTQYIARRRDARQVSTYSDRPSKIGTPGPVCRLQIRLGRAALHSADVHQLTDLAAMIERKRIPAVIKHHLSFSEFDWGRAFERYRPGLTGPGVSGEQVQLYWKLLRHDLVTRLGDTIAAGRFLVEFFCRPDTPWPRRDVPMLTQRDLWRHGPSFVGLLDDSGNPDELTVSGLLERWRDDPAAALALALDRGLEREPPFRRRPDYRLTTEFDMLDLLERYADQSATH